jgi:hypothetical protein
MLLAMAALVLTTFLSYRPIQDEPTADLRLHQSALFSNTSHPGVEAKDHPDERPAPRVLNYASDTVPDAAPYELPSAVKHFESSLRTLESKRAKLLWEEEVNNLHTVAYSIRRPEEDEIARISAMFSDNMVAVPIEQRNATRIAFQAIYDQDVGFPQEFKVVFKRKPSYTFYCTVIESDTANPSLWQPQGNGSVIFPGGTVDDLVDVRKDPHTSRFGHILFPEK